MADFHCLPLQCGSVWTCLCFSHTKNILCLDWALCALQMKGRWESNTNVWFPFMYSQKWNCAASLFPVFQFLHSYTCERYSIYFSRICLSILLQPISGTILWIYKLLTDPECMNWDWGYAIPFSGIHKLDFWYSVVQTVLLFFDWLLHASKSPDVLYCDLLFTCCIVKTLGCSVFWLDF